jgi:spermidine synthase
MATANSIRQFTLGLGFGILLTFPLQGQGYQIVYEVRSQYQLITVRDTPYGHRQLIFDGKFDGMDATQSEINLSDRDELTASYARHIMTALPLVPRIKRILIVGLGGGCMQRFLHRLLPTARIETVELDPEIRNVAAKYFFLQEDDRQVVHIGDGRRFIESSKDRYDIIFLDAFSATSIPYHLATQEFLKSVKAHLVEGGLVCANLWDGEADFPDMLKTYESVFPELHLVQCAASGNSILVALTGKAGLSVRAWMDKAEALEKTNPTGLSLPMLIQRGAAETISIPTNARVLVDKNPTSITNLLNCANYSDDRSWDRARLARIFGMVRAQWICGRDARAPRGSASAILVPFCHNISRFSIGNVSHQTRQCP